MKRALSLIALVFVMLTQIGDAQSVTVAWDPAVDTVWTIPEYRVYRNDVSIGQTTALSVPVLVSPGETVSLAVSSWGWKLDDSLNVVWAEGNKSPAITYTAPPAPTPLSLIPPPDQTVTTQSNPTVVFYPAPTPSGGVAPYLTTCDPASGSSLYAGSVQVVCATRDSAGQIASTSFALTLVYVAPPTPAGCVTGGTLAPIGARLNQTMKNGDADPFILARKAEGWVLLSRTKARNLTSVSMECRGK